MTKSMKVADEIRETWSGNGWLVSVDQSDRVHSHTTLWYPVVSYLMTQTDSLGNTFRPSWAIIFCSFQFKCSWSDNPHRKNLDLPDYVRLQLDHNASRAFNHNAFRLLTSIMTRSARVLSRTKKASLFVILYFLELVFSGILPNISGAKAKQSLDIHSQYLTFIYGSAFSDQHLWAGA